MLAYVAAAVVAVWGVAHAIPTRAVVAAFEPLRSDNRRILIQEWLAEAIAMVGLAAVVVVAAAAGGSLAAPVERAAAALLVALAALTAATGARTGIVWFRVCPFLLTGAAALLVAASFV